MEAKQIKKQVVWFTVLNDELYKRGFLQPYLRCVEKEKAKYVLEEVHEGICGDHMEAKSLARKIIRAGYFWPPMQQDVADFIKKCDSCQRYGDVQRVPREKMMAITSPWPFAQWGINIMGPLPQGKRQVKFLLVAIDYFTKWVEAEALATRSQKQRYKVLYGKILCAGSRSHRRSSRIMVVNSTIKDSDRFAQASVSRTNIHPWGILKPTDKLK